MTVNLVRPVDNAEIYSMAKDFNLALHKSNVAAASVEPTPQKNLITNSSRKRIGTGKREWSCPDPGSLWKTNL